MKKPYAKPVVETEAAFEVLAAGCGLNDPTLIGACDPLSEGTVAT